MEDLFGHTPEQAELFAPPAPASPPAGGPKRPPYTAEDIREKMLAILAQARAADRMPWNPRKLHSHKVMFPIMAEWFPKEEGDQMVLEFKAELERLEA